MSKLPSAYNAAEAEKRWQERWEKEGVYAFRDDLSREETFVIDTPPPTVSGVLHMGHVFSYAQGDFVARYQRMAGKDVCYPMGFDDNGLPTERLVEKIKGKKAAQYESREAFIADCREVVAEAEKEFEALFKSIALSVDWSRKYQTVSDRVTALSQASFIELLQKGEAYRDFRPTYWDWVDQTAIAAAEIEDKEMPGMECIIPFGIFDKAAWARGERPIWETLEKKPVMTTRPELLGACVALMCHSDDKHLYEEKIAITPLFNVAVPIIDDDKVDKEKGTGLVMCCTFGDDTDKEWVRKHLLPTRPLLQTDGRIGFLPQMLESTSPVSLRRSEITFFKSHDGFATYGVSFNQSSITEDNCINFNKALAAYKQIEGLKPKQANAKMVGLLQAEGKLLKSTPITHSVKCAERSGTPIEIIPTQQWYIRTVDKKEALLEKGRECAWHPEYMRIRLEQWIEGLKEDWCISRQRFFGVPFPVWYSKRAGEEGKILVAEPGQLPVNPLIDLPDGYSREEVTPDADVMDTWATSSLTPQINAGSLCSPLEGEQPRSSAKRDERGVGGIMPHVTPHDSASANGLASSAPPHLSAVAPPGNSENRSHKEAKAEGGSKLFPADLRPQAHEIIRSWAFYTIVKAYLHADPKERDKPGIGIPWKDVMISGWCLASDKSKMSKSKGNVVTPVSLIAEKSADAVRYWASTSRLGQDTAFSEDLLKIGRKLVTKLWNASNFVSLQLEKLQGEPSDTAKEDTGWQGAQFISPYDPLPINTGVQQRTITEPLDVWILSRLSRAIEKATKEFVKFEYCDARVAVEDFFWNDFCDNYLELVKARAYGENTSDRAQQSGLYTLYHCLSAILRLFAPFVPHVTEEIYSHLFSGRGSIHARGTWPKASDYPHSEEAEMVGMAAVEVLASIRKAKSEAGVSIKYPLECVDIYANTAGNNMLWLFKKAEEDIKAAGNVKNFRLVEYTEPVEVGTLTPQGWYRIAVTLAAGEAA